MNAIAKMVLVLTVICVLSALALAVVYDLTKEKIAENKESELTTKINSLFGKAVKTEPCNCTGGHIVASFDVYDENNEWLGKAFVIEYPGYQGNIGILVGTTGTEIIGIDILSHTETPGLGARIEEDSFKSQFKNKKTLDFDTITGATISSTAVINAVKECAFGYDGITSATPKNESN